MFHYDLTEHANTTIIGGSFQTRTATGPCGSAGKATAIKLGICSRGPAGIAELVRGLYKAPATAMFE